MILHLLFSFKSLLAFESSTFEFVLLVHKCIVFHHLFGRGESHITDLAGLNQSFDATLVAKVRAAQFKGCMARGLAL